MKTTLRGECGCGRIVTTGHTCFCSINSILLMDNRNRCWKMSGFLDAKQTTPRSQGMMLSFWRSKGETSRSKRIGVEWGSCVSVIIGSDWSFMYRASMNAQYSNGHPKPNKRKDHISHHRRFRCAGAFRHLKDGDNSTSIGIEWPE